MRVKIIIVCGLAALAAAAAAPAFANPGAGGGGLSPVPAGPKVDPAQAYRDGVAAYQAGDYKTAEDKFKDVLSVAPDHPESNYLMGLCKVRLGKDKQSTKYFKRAVKERSDFVEAREELALVSVRLGDVEEAQKQLAALKEMEAKCADACERVKGAIAAIEAALAPPSDSEGGPAEDETDESAAEGSEFSYLFLERGEGVARYRDAVKLVNEARYEEAISVFYEAQAIVGPHPDILNYLGFAHRKLARFDEAKRYYGQALALMPDHKGANEYLGELYLEIGEIDKARRQLARLDEICTFGCAEREDLARLIAVKAGDRRAAVE
jgi:tetratricopeptide (TPR) repeat protein